VSVDNFGRNGGNEDVDPEIIFEVLREELMLGFDGQEGIAWLEEEQVKGEEGTKPPKGYEMRLVTWAFEKPNKKRLKPKRRGMANRLAICFGTEPAWVQLEQPASQMAILASE
jgi:hypothetical protein